MKISVITINYNNVSGLQKTLESIFQQTFKDFEYIVIDGGSVDGSRELLENNRDKFAYWISEKDKGIYDAMNKGIQKAKGEYLLFINSGDYLAENTTLEKAAAHLDGTKIVYGNLKIEQDGSLTEGFMPDAIDLDQMMRDTLWHPVSFIKKELFDTYGLYKTEYKICSDYDFFFNVIVDKKVSTKHINQFIAVFDLLGMSSRPENVSLIAKEKKLIQATYLSKEQIREYSSKNSKSNFFTKWFR